MTPQCKEKGKKDIINKLEIYASFSNCSKIHFGALITNRERSIISLGFNQAVIHKCCLRKYIKSGTQIEQCCAIHAEQMAIINAKRDLSNCKLWTLGILPNGELLNNKRFYCTMCARIIFATNIKSVMLWRNNNWVEVFPEKILEEAYADKTNFS
ncbi:MAG TPA: hypothetical protein VMZ91_13575 [Candidatus Paceibacterota bacterium]|nr:hypothetical protein [Candidatus Paceibacterota bacterium]